MLREEPKAGVTVPAGDSIRQPGLTGPGPVRSEPIRFPGTPPACPAPKPSAPRGTSGRRLGSGGRQRGAPGEAQVPRCRGRQTRSKNPERENDTRHVPGHLGRRQCLGHSYAKQLFIVYPQFKLSCVFGLAQRGVPQGFSAPPTHTHTSHSCRWVCGSASPRTLSCERARAGLRPHLPPPDMRMRSARSPPARAAGLWSLDQPRQHPSGAS